MEYQKRLNLLNEANDSHCTKTVFPRFWNIIESSKRLSKYFLYINFLTKKKPNFPSLKSSKQQLFGSPKQELFSNQ